MYIITRSRGTRKGSRMREKTGRGTPSWAQSASDQLPSRRGPLGVPYPKAEACVSYITTYLLQFDQIEQEEAAQQQQQQQQAPAAQDTATAVPALDDEQAKFQQAASEIYARLSPGPQTPPEMEAKLHNPKLQNSKFLGLMRRISDGVVTLQNDQNSQKYTQLYSPTTGEVVGNEYFPVVDAILEP